MTSSRRSCSKSTSISGGSLRSWLTKRSNNKSLRSGSIEVMPSTKQTAELADDPQQLLRRPLELLGLRAHASGADRGGGGAMSARDMRDRQKLWQDAAIAW